MQRLAETKRTWISFRGGAYSGRQPVRCWRRPRSRRRSRCGEIGRAGPQEGLAVDVGAGTRGVARRRAAAVDARPGAGAGREPAGAGHQGRSNWPIRSPRSMSTSPRTMRSSKPSSRGGHERPCHLRHGPDGHAARDLHAVPAPLRDAAGAVAAAVPAVRDRVDARLRAAPDRPRRSSRKSIIRCCSAERSIRAT